MLDILLIICAKQPRTWNSYAMPYANLNGRFYNFVIIPDDPDACWGWGGAKTELGYGRIQKGSPYHFVMKAHRASWEIHNGPIPDGLDVCHRCDNPECTNPRHLFLGTHADNMADASRKGIWEGKGRGISRNAGATNGRAKLSDDQVQAILRLISAGNRQRDVAAQFGISQPHVSQLVNERRRRAASALE